jgi:hypothetical protein
MINRVLDIVNTIVSCKDAISALNQSYENKSKGQIYYTSLEYQNKRIKQFGEKLKSFGDGKVTLWKVIIKIDLGSGSTHKTLHLHLDSSITVPEIEARMSILKYTNQVGSLEIVSLIPENYISLGFPTP